MFTFKIPEFDKLRDLYLSEYFIADFFLAFGELIKGLRMHPEAIGRLDFASQNVEPRKG